MKKFYALLLLLFISIGASQAQISCGFSIPLSTGSYTGTLLTGTPNYDTTSNYGCLGAAHNATWFHFEACTSGPLMIFLYSSGSSAADADFVIWGPLADSTVCGLGAGQILDCSNAVIGMDTIMVPYVNAGEVFKLLISNPSNMPGSYTLASSGGGFASFSGSCSPCTGPVPMQEICHVTTDPVLNRNIIIFNKDIAYTGSYEIERETTAMGVYSTISTLANSDSSAFMDTISNPMIHPFSYRIRTSDTCGNTISSGPHTTIHLLTSISSSTGFPQLSWSMYHGFLFGTYYIYRGTSASTLMPYDSVSSTILSYTDVLPVTGMNYYAISVVRPVPCTPSRSISDKSLSNVGSATFTGIREQAFGNFNVSPNPASDQLNFRFDKPSDIRVQMIDITGRIVLSEEFKDISAGMIGISSLSNGSYLLQLSSAKGTAHRNVVIAR